MLSEFNSRPLACPKLFTWEFECYWNVAHWLACASSSTCYPVFETPKRTFCSVPSNNEPYHYKSNMPGTNTKLVPSGGTGPAWTETWNNGTCVYKYMYTCKRWMTLKWCWFVKVVCTLMDCRLIHHACLLGLRTLHWSN